MKAKEILFVLGCVIILLVIVYLSAHSTSQEGPTIINNNENYPMALNLTSPAFGNNADIPAKYSCQGDNINPPLIIEGTDPNAKSLVLIMDDPDAATVVGHTFDHWIKFNIDPRTLQIEEGKEPLGTAGKNGTSGFTYTGPCPPSGIHHYYFKLYSLDTMLTLPEGASKAEVEAAMQGHILQQSELIGLYSKK